MVLAFKKTSQLIYWFPKTKRAVAKLRAYLKTFSIENTALTSKKKLHT